MSPSNGLPAPQPSRRTSLPLPLPSARTSTPLPPPPSLGQSTPRPSLQPPVEPPAPLTPATPPSATTDEEEDFFSLDALNVDTESEDELTSAKHEWESTPEQDSPEPLFAINPDLSPRLDDAIGGIIIKEETDGEELNIDDLLEEMLDLNGSDLHLSARNYPCIRVHGAMTPIETHRKLSGDEINRMVTDIMSTQQRNKFEEEWELDFAYDLVGRSRFRVNVMRQRGEVSVTMRTIPWEIKTVEELGLPAVMREWSQLTRGLVLVTGPTGSGKSTSLAAIIDHANRTRKGHIVTIEDPIEFIHEHKGCVINQREVGTDTKSFAHALKHVLRQDPDIILVGELRDLETISVAISAAETGHLVFGTLHTQSAGETISRIIDVFPEGSQTQIRTQLAATIQGIACQTLLKSYDGNSRRAAVEVLVGTSALRNVIREGKLEQVQSSLQSGTRHGMQTLDAELEKLVLSGQVHWREAHEKASDKATFLESLGGEEGAEKIDRRVAVQRKGGF